MENEISCFNVKLGVDTILTKRPLDCLDLATIFTRLVDRDLRVIFCVRDPRDVICSVHRLVPHDYFLGYKNQYFIDGKNQTISLSNPGLKQVYAAWRGFADKVLTVRYEDLVLRPETVQRAIYAHVDEQPKGDFSEFSESSKVSEKMVVALNGARQIDSKGVGIWRKHPQRVWQEFTDNPALFEMVIGLGYEVDTEWFRSTYRSRLAYL